MSDYRVTVTCPVELTATASAVGRAMDIDVGGADSFVERDGVLVAQTWASAEFATMFDYLIRRPEALQMAVAADYEVRWPSMQPPTMQCLIEFCGAATMVVVPEMA